MYTAITPPEMVAMPPIIRASSSDLVIDATYGLMMSGRLGLAHEHVGRRGQGLGPAHPATAEHEQHDLGEHPDDQLQDAQVVQNGEHGGHEDDGRQGLDGEDEPVARAERPSRPSRGSASGPKTNVGPLVGEVEELGHRPARATSNPW